MLSKGILYLASELKFRIWTDGILTAVIRKYSKIRPFLGSSASTRMKRICQMEGCERQERQLGKGVPGEERIVTGGDHASRQIVHRLLHGKGKGEGARAGCETVTLTPCREQGPGAS